METPAIFSRNIPIIAVAGDLHLGTERKQQRHGEDLFVKLRGEEKK